MYSVKLDREACYDKALERVFDAENEFTVLDLPLEFTDDFAKVKRQYRAISLAVHPDRNHHPQAAAGFRKVYGAFEVLSDLKQQRRLLISLGVDDPRFAAMDDDVDDEDEESFQWWWEASVPEVERAAEEAEGYEMDTFAKQYVSDGRGSSVDDVPWIGLRTAQDLQNGDDAIFIDVREPADLDGGTIPGAWNVPMSAVMRHGLMNVLPRELIQEILRARKHQTIVGFFECYHATLSLQSLLSVYIARGP